MRKVIIWFLWAVVNGVLAVVGFYAVDPSQRPQFLADFVRKLMPLLQDNWVALALFTVALSSTILWILWPLAYGWLHRSIKRELVATCGLRDPIESPDQANRVSGRAALAYISRSRWAAREYRRLNGMIHLSNLTDEFQRAARTGSIRVAGLPPNEVRLVWIPPHYWDAADLVQSSIYRRDARSEVRAGARFNYRGLVNYSSISVVKSDLVATWRTGSKLGSWLSKAVVWLKKLWFAVKPEALWGRWERYRAKRRERVSRSTTGTTTADVASTDRKQADAEEI